MDEQRPDPEQLLRQIDADEAQSKRGRLKIFFGACAGVGKTYAMLAAAKNLSKEGIAPLIGIIETHGRTETEALTRGLRRLPLREFKHRGRVLRELDLDEALAFAVADPRTLLLVDELAHSNAPGSRHPKRWQDVVELLDAGIDVWTTMNVQHLEHLNDIVSGITGIRIWETVPDHLFDAAEEVVVIDLPPDELIERLNLGKIYLPKQAEVAARNFFRKGNLLALRELALRRAADRIDNEMLAYRRHNTISRIWPNRESLLVCIGDHDGDGQIVRSSARLAAKLGVGWHVVHVETPRSTRISDANQEPIRAALRLADELGAKTTSLTAQRVAPALVRYAHENNLSRLVLGRRPRRWLRLRALADELAAEGGDLDILQIAHTGPKRPQAKQQQRTFLPIIGPARGYWVALAACGGVTLATHPLAATLKPTNIVMIFLLAVVVVALRHGRGPALLAAVSGVASFDFFFVPPYYTFAVADTRYYVATFLVMLIVALVIGQLTAGLKLQAETSRASERRMQSLYEMSRALSAALLPEQVAEISARFITAEFGAKSALLTADDQGHLGVLEGATAHVDMAVAQWSFEHAQPAGKGTGTLYTSPCLVLPLKATMRLRGALVIESAELRPFDPEQRRVLDTCASLLAISIERIHYIDVARNATVQMESERTRNSLLSAISHELRTPLSAMIGLAEALEWADPEDRMRQRELARAISDSARRMNTMANNLLDLARLESGVVRLNLQWQPLEETIGSAVSACRSLLGERRIDISLPADLPLLPFDAVLIERVIVNLLENAAKYTPEGTQIDISAGKGDTVVTLSVCDHGPGLPPGREHLIFEKFERGRPDGSPPGVGLGLAFCRAVMHTHGGVIQARDRKGGGTCFELEFPRQAPPPGSRSTGSREVEDV
ncbi:two-component system sensor histidine kinase KdbD [Acidihalobacter aeolianus]|uniref:histidine kinase n=1 Tax=Acidihalobacter aeolianus TaxID=2792603 RepID=A0A1D8K4T3_9GAMM|nr:DUF4118 domain-containing protein [Acidihalobacter aeolianus]AOV15969.1 two-component system sensor histidine kinase KdbD [Acidihalobacter aeolianus]